MEKSPTYQFYLGSSGWEHPDWVGSFYPVDLPPEWRLAYYNTQFSCVYLAYAEWSGCSLKALASWVEDTQDRFRFVLETNPSGLTEADRLGLEALAPRIGLVPGDQGWPEGRVVWLEKEPDLKRLARELPLLAANPAPVYLISRDHGLAAMNRLKTLLEIMGL